MLLETLANIVREFDISPSDGLLLYCLLPAVAFPLAYAITAPWWNVKKFGWFGIVTLIHSMSVLMLLFLISYAIIFGQKVDETYRVVIALTLAVGLTSKMILYFIERSRGVRIRHDERLRRAREAQAEERVLDGS